MGKDSDGAFFYLGTLISSTDYGLENGVFFSYPGYSYLLYSLNSSY